MAVASYEVRRAFLVLWLWEAQISDGRSGSGLAATMEGAKMKARRWIRDHREAVPNDARGDP